MMRPITKGEFKFRPQFRLIVEGSHRPPAGPIVREGATFVPWAGLSKTGPAR